jgi:hypothetical protein
MVCFFILTKRWDDFLTGRFLRMLPGHVPDAGISLKISRQIVKKTVIPLIHPPVINLKSEYHLKYIKARLAW